LAEKIQNNKHDEDNKPNASLPSADSFTTVAGNNGHFMLNFKFNLTETKNGAIDAVNKQFLIHHYSFIINKI
jgi:hypothetical protein